MTTVTNAPDPQEQWEIINIRIVHIQETLTRIESSMVRTGERMGLLESDMNNIKIGMASHSGEDKAVAKDVEDLKDTRTKIMWAIISSIILSLLSLLGLKK